MKRLISFSIFTLLAIGSTIGQTVIPDKTEVSGTWTKANSPYLVNGKVTIPSGKTLTIEPGVIVKLKTGTNFDYSSVGFDAGMIDVIGNLIAVGTTVDSIIFTRNGTEGNWGIIFFPESTADSSKIAFCRVNYAGKIKKTFNGQQEQTGAVTIIKRKLEIRNSLISKNANCGIRTESCSPLIRGSRISSNGVDGIYLRVDSEPQIINNLFSENGASGIYNTSNKSCLFCGNIFFKNRWGIYETYQESSIIANNTIVLNKDYGLYKDDNSTGKQSFIINNIICDNGTNIQNCSLYTVGNTLIGDNSTGYKIKVLNGNIFARSPLFADNLTYKLKSNSPAINSGTMHFAGSDRLPLNDINGMKRILKDSIDMGATEFEGQFLSLSDPSDEDYFQFGQKEKISWKSSGTGIKIDYKAAFDNTWITITSFTENDGEYEWLVPTTLADSCWLRISDTLLPQFTDTVFVRFSKDKVIRNKEIVYGTWYKSRSPYLVLGEAIIPSWKTLTIESGVTVKLKTGTIFDYTSNSFNAGMILVYGKLTARGTETDSIRFIRNDITGNWGSILFLNQTDTVILDKCIFEYGNMVSNVVPEDYFKSSMGAVTFFRSNLLVQKCTFRNNKERGVYVIRESSCKLTGNRFYGNNIGAEISIGSFGNDLTFNNVFYKNSIGLQISSAGKVYDNSFFDNSRAGILTTYGTAIYQNTIFNNEAGIEGKPTSGNWVGNNYIHHNNYGINFYNEGSSSLINNLITHNNIGVSLKSLNSCKLINNTIENNKVSGFNHYGCYFTELKNNIHWNNQTEFVYDLEFSIQNSLVQDPVLPDGINDLGENLLNTDPLFSDTLKQDFSLLRGSPCINSGTIDTAGLRLPTVDRSGKNRIRSGRVDIGAYEYQDNTAFVRIQKPYFHEYLVSNLYYDLKWNLSDSLSFVKLLYSPDKGVTWQTITASTPNYGVYKWKVPEIFADSCLWAVVDMAKPTIGDTSRYYFTISPNIIPDGCKFYGKLMEKYSPYQILGKVEIPKDSVLMIEPGTEIKLKTGDDFSEDYRSNDKANVGAVFVYGKLVANGLQNKIIRFTRLENNGKWGSVVFDSSSKKNTLEYCSFQYSNRYEMIIGSSIYLNGGTINIYSDSVSVKNSYFHHAYNGIYTNYKAKGIIIKNCVISNNENNGIDGYNGNAINCTITNNKGTGVYATFSIKNCIIHSNGKSMVNPFNYSDSNARIAYSLIEEKTIPQYYINSGGVIFNLPPQFVDPMAGDYHLSPNSPCIDKGDPADDYSIEPMPNGGRIDMGAFGNTSEATSFQALPRIDFLSVYKCSVLGNDTLTITGKYFLASKGTGKVMFGNVPSSQYLNWNDSVIVCIIPPQPADTIDISVTGNNGWTGIRKSIFTYIVPDILKADPSYGTTAGGKQISISGKNFGKKQFASSISIGGITVTQVKNWADTLVTVITPANTEGFKEIKFASGTVIQTYPNAFLYTNTEPVIVCGTVSGTWSLNNVYILSCNTEVPVNKKLVIEKGVKVISAVNTSPISFTVNGTLEVKGAPGDSVLFTSVPGMSGNWQGFIVNATAKFDYIKVQYAVDGIRVNTTDFNLNHSALRFNSNSGIFFDGDERSASGKVLNSLFENNKTGIVCSAFCSESGGSASPEIWSNGIRNNQGDGILCDAGGWVPSYGVASRSSSASPVIIGNLIENNGSYAIRCSSSDDEAESYGGILMHRQGYANPRFENNILKNNEGTVSSHKYGTRGNADVEVINNTIYNNGEILASNAKVIFENSIIREEVPVIRTEEYGSVSFNYCCVKNQGGTNINADPQFQNSSQGNFRLKTDSPCIDAGKNSYVTTTSDFDNKVRIWNATGKDSAIVDIGAFEFNAPCYLINEKISICNGQSYQGWTVSGNYQRTLKTGAGCDSVVNTVLTVHPLYNITENKSICQGQNYQGWSTAGTYQRYLKSKAGCDSLVTTILTVTPLPVLSIPLTATACSKSLFLYVPTSNTPNTTFTWKRNTVSGISNPAATGTGPVSEILVNTYTYSRSVTYTFTLTANGCSNTQNVVVTVNPKPYLSSSQTYGPVCNNTAFTYTPACPVSSTTFSWMRAAVQGISNPAGSGTVKITETLVNTTPDEITVPYTIKLSAAGCDSVQTVTVKVKPTPVLSSSLTPPAICSGNVFSYTPACETSGATLSWKRASVSGISNPTASGTGPVSETLTNTTGKSVTVIYEYTMGLTGCTSNRQNITVMVNPVYDITEKKSVCDGQSYQGWSSSGYYTRTLKSLSGCDSIVTTALTVMTPYQPLVVQTGDTLRSANQYKSYQWYNESGMIAGATGRTYVISKSWKYHLVITDEIGCTNTSESISAIWSDAKITESGEFRYSIIPNPNRGQFIFRIDSGSGNEITLHLFNPLGQTIETRRMKQAGCNHSEQFDVSYLSKGMYYLVISAEKMIRTEKIVFH